MINDILLCIEGGASTQRALDAAVVLAKSHGARLIGLSIVDEPDIRAGASTGIGNSSFKHQRDEALLADANEKTGAWLAAFEARCKDEGVVSDTLLLVGRPAERVLDEMDRHDVTFVGRHVNFLFETHGVDRHTRDAILHRATKPVIVVPETPISTSAVVAIAYDGSAASKRALHRFVASGMAKNKTLHVVSVDDDGADAWETATRGCAILAEMGAKANPENVVSRLSIAQAVAHKATELRAGLIVMGAYASPRIKTLLWGSVTRELIETTPIPLFLHH